MYTQTRALENVTLHNEQQQQEELLYLLYLTELVLLLHKNSIKDVEISTTYYQWMKLAFSLLSQHMCSLRTHRAYTPRRHKPLDSTWTLMDLGGYKISVTDITKACMHRHTSTTHADTENMD